jgi:MinD-like ATPase involved in chromosome partitioning or flagellar assembly
VNDHDGIDGSGHHHDPAPTQLAAEGTDEAPSRFSTSFTAGNLGSTAPPPRDSPSAAELGLTRSERAPVRHGWRKALHRATGGTVTAGMGADDRTGPVRPARLDHGICSIAVLSMKGGVGKTTTTVGLGSTIATMRGDRVIAVDANPDLGTLAQRGPDQVRSTVRDLLADRSIAHYSDVRRHTSQSLSRLEFLGSARDPAVSEAFSETDFLNVHQVLGRFYNVVLTDCGTGLTHSAVQGVLNAASALVVVASPAIDSARSALATLDWLEHHGFGYLAAHASVVVNSPWAGDTSVNVSQLTRYFNGRVQNVVVVPHDDHLAEGGEIQLDRLNRKTRSAYAALASAMPSAVNHGRLTGDFTQRQVGRAV